MMDDNFRGNLPISVHTGDYNMDGYPDLLVTTNKRVVLLQSILCTEELCTSEAVQAEKRSFSLVTTGVEALESVPKPRQAAFFDIDEDVRNYYGWSYITDLLLSFFFLKKKGIFRYGCTSIYLFIWCWSCTQLYYQ